ncbi:uncharacterized protein LOC111022074 [Momordica charantia]|uniref:Uncharacterized protein LOC111022074 n=1 Tax=Momordica charantia TaxID=3673 RepID=A0A6J1DLM1_MOMCH|nr:uncharacterized protein LOC111022074 [Momordica charantia]
MFTSLISLLDTNKLTGDNYPMWKTNLNVILVVDDLYFVLTEACLEAVRLDATKVVRDAYERRIKANSKARVYILANISDILAKKHETMITALEIMDSLYDMFGKLFSQVMHEALKFISNLRMKEGKHLSGNMFSRISSLRQLEAGKMSLRVGIGEIISVVAMGSVKLFFSKRRYMLLDNVYIVPQMKRNLIYVACLLE